MERIQKLKRNDREVLYYDLSDIKTNEELNEVVQMAKKTISGYTYDSVYTITNISRIAFDSKTKEIAADWMAYNKPFVIHSAFIGVTGVRKIMMKAVFTLSGRSNTKLFHDMEEALLWIESKTS